MTLDLMAIGFPKNFEPYTREDGWTVVLPGEEEVRGDKIVVASSDVEIRLKSSDDVQKCIRILEGSDRRLKLVFSNPWNWGPAMYKGNIIRFGVAWYDLEFFESRKNAWFGDDHRAFYSQFGATVDDFTVNHRIL